MNTRLKFTSGWALAIFATGSYAAGDSLQQAAQLRDAAMAGDHAHVVVEDLVKTAPFRFAGSDNNRKAVNWAVAEMKRAGLSHVHTEAVTVPRWERGSIAIRLLGEKPQWLEAVALGGSVGTADGGFEAPVLMVDSLDALYAVPLAEVKGKIVFFNGRMERRADGGGYGATVPQRTKGAAEAARRGALAVVIRSVGTNHDREAHTGAMRYDDAAPKIPAAALSSVDADLLEQRLRDSGAAELHVDIQAHERGKAEAANVIGEIPGTGEGIVLLAAHLDSWDITPGANDDGAGVGILLEAARNILALGAKPQRTIRFLLTANEEFGLSGAKDYVKRHQAEIAQHQVALEADFGSGAVTVVNAGVSDADWPQLQPLDALLKAIGSGIGENGKDGGADTGPLHQRGVPVLVPRQDGTRYFDVHHTRADTIETLDHKGLQQNVAVYSMLAWVAANAAPYGRVPVTAAD